METMSPSQHQKPSPKQLRKHLDQIKASKMFADSLGGKKILDFMLSEYLNDRHTQLTRKTIAWEVFQNDNDAAVGPAIGRLRQKLNEYYKSADPADPIRIDVPHGGCVPTVNWTGRSSPDAPETGTQLGLETRSSSSEISSQAREDKFQFAASNRVADKLLAHSRGRGTVLRTLLRSVRSLRANHKTAEGVHHRNRLSMLKRVRSDWIEGVLKQSLYRIARFELGLEAKNDALESPLNTIVQIQDRVPVAVPPGTGIVDVFDSLDQALLILGAPGAGKTTLLLELTEKLLDRALEDVTHPIPVVFNLSTWAVKREGLSYWLISELKQRSGVPSKLARRWVENGEILPLLDGLDEVSITHQSACVRAINQFREQDGLRPIAVCSRTIDFEALATKLRLRGAIAIQPLTKSQVVDYLTRSRGLQPLRDAVSEDPSLGDLFETPLMLWVAMMTYRGIPVEIVKEEFPEAKRHRLFSNFVTAMFERRSPQIRYSKDETLRWLTYLATALNRNQQTVFYLEDLNPNWLSRRRTRWLLHASTIVTCSFFVGVIMSIIGGVIGSLIAIVQPNPSASLVLTVLGYCLLGVISGFPFGLLQGFVSAAVVSLTKPKPAGGVQFRISYARKRLGNAMRPGLILGLISGLLCFAFTSLFLFFPKNVFSELSFRLGTGLLMGSMVGFFVGLVGLLTNEKIETLRRPNEGTRNSIKNALTMMVVSVPLFALFFGLFLALLREASGLHDIWTSVGGGILIGLFFGLLFGPLGGLLGGGMFAVRHFVLRFMLWRGRSAPLKYVEFLNYASERLFLQRVGGGYVFTHRMLLEYFASLREPGTL